MSYVLKFRFVIWKILLYVYRLKSVVFQGTVHISDVPSGKSSVTVHSTHFWCTV